MALAHEPRSSVSSDGVGGHVPCVGGHHVEGTAGVPLRVRLEIVGPQIPPVQMDVAGVGFMHD